MARRLKAQSLRSYTTSTSAHDNNRDWYIFSQVETRLTIKSPQRWHPQIVYDVHQQGAYASRMFVPPWLDPIDPNIDPIIAQLCNAIGAGMAADLTVGWKDRGRTSMRCTTSGLRLGTIRRITAGYES